MKTNRLNEEIANDAITAARQTLSGEPSPEQTRWAKKLESAGLELLRMVENDEDATDYAASVEDLENDIPGS